MHSIVRTIMQTQMFHVEHIVVLLVRTSCSPGACTEPGPATTLLLRPRRLFLAHPLAHLEHHLPSLLVGVHHHVVAVQHRAVENL
jgi:hypothetical protein